MLACFHHSIDLRCFYFSFVSCLYLVFTIFFSFFFFFLFLKSPLYSLSFFFLLYSSSFTSKSSSLTSSSPWPTLPTSWEASPRPRTTLRLFSNLTFGFSRMLLSGLFCLPLLSRSVSTTRLVILSRRVQLLVPNLRFGLLWVPSSSP